MAWRYELTPGLHYKSGSAEIPGALGLVLPGLTKIMTWLTSLTAAGLVLVMLIASCWHLIRGEMMNIGGNLVIAALAAFVAYGRRRLKSLRVVQG